MKDAWRRRLKKTGLVSLGILAALGAFGYYVYGGATMQHAGEPEGSALSPDTVQARIERQEHDAAEAPTRILFGDLHVHTTFSMDAYMRSVPLLGGVGAHPPADACDFARYCSELDFYALTDHAEMLSPRMWDEERESVRQCNAISAQREGPGGERDLIAFTGFEWTQVGRIPEEHWGHRNVIYRRTDDAHLPTRPIAAGGLTRQVMSNVGGEVIAPVLRLPFLDFEHRDMAMDVLRFLHENSEVPPCPEGRSPDLPGNCRETAETPADLFRKLNEWGQEAIVIPHGTTWGFYTPPGYSFDKQLAPEQDDPERQRLIEVYSGHGNTEEYRPYRHVLSDEELPEDAEVGDECPAPTDDFEPCCHRAGEILRGRCEDPSSEECEVRVREARRNYVRAVVGGHLTINAEASEWGECGVCTDCFLPTFRHVPRSSVQYILARGHFEDGESEGAAEARHLTLGFIGSSDNHSARPGTGYKEFARFDHADVTGPATEEAFSRYYGPRPPAETSRVLTPDTIPVQDAFLVAPLERGASFFYTGGLVAVHVRERSRDAIFDALMNREVYGTSGDRILLWFDLMAPSSPREEADAGVAPESNRVQAGMGSVVPDVGVSAPTFRVRALGAFEQQPGCPPDRLDGLGAERLERLCGGECYHPGDRRRRITRVEVVRIRPQRSPEETIADLIDDPFLTLPCPEGEDLCEVRFSDPDHPSATRDALYYVRAIQEPSPAVNGANLRCDESGQCQPCYGDYRAERGEACLAPVEERAWSSPIFLRPADED